MDSQNNYFFKWSSEDNSWVNQIKVLMPRQRACLKLPNSNDTIKIPNNVPKYFKQWTTTQDIFIKIFERKKDPKQPGIPIRKLSLPFTLLWPIVDFNLFCRYIFPKLVKLTE